MTDLRCWSCGESPSAAVEETIEKLRAGLAEALDKWQLWDVCLCPASGHLDDCQLVRIVELRKLTEAP